MRHLQVGPVRGDARATEPHHSNTHADTRVTRPRVVPVTQLQKMGA
jgi:hypothetical protein